MNDMTAYFTAGIALVAVLLGPLITMKQIRASTVSTFRQKWIDELRSDLSRLIATMTRIPDARKLNDPELPKLKQETMELVSRIILRLNTNEADHKELEEMLGCLRGVVFNHPIDKEPDGELWRHKEDIITLSRRILKREWERVKRFG